MSPHGAHPVRLLKFVTLSLLLFLCLTGCPGKAAHRSTGAATVGSRTVKYSVAGTAGTITSDGSQDATTIASTAGTIVVQKTRVLLDGKEVAQLREDTRLVEIDYADGKLIITADGNRLPEAQPRR